LRRRQLRGGRRDHRRPTRPTSSFIVVGDMNDPPDSPFLAPLVSAPGSSCLPASPTPRKPAPARSPSPPTGAWTERFNGVGPRRRCQSGRGDVGSSGSFQVAATFVRRAVASAWGRWW
jgi:hypothetical protein